MTIMQLHDEAVGRILEHLFEGGLSKITLGSKDAISIMKQSCPNDTKDLSWFVDVIQWMSDEGFIRYNDSFISLDGNGTFSGVQLTSHGRAAMQAKTDDEEGARTIEEIINQKPEEGLAPQTYVRIGSVIGGILGGAIKSIS